MTNNNLVFKKDNLNIILNHKKKLLDDEKVEQDSAIIAMCEEIDVSDPQIIKNWAAPLFSIIKDEEQLKEFLILFIAYYRSYVNISNLNREIQTIEMILDSNNMLSLATVSFDELETVDEQRRD